MKKYGKKKYGKKYSKKSKYGKRKGRGIQLKKYKVARGGERM